MFWRRFVARTARPSNSLEPREQIRGLEVRVPVVRVADVRPASEQRVGFVEEEDGLRALGRVEDLGQVLLRLADPLRHDARDVDDEEVDAEFGGEHLGRQRLPCAWRTCKQHAHAACAAASVEEAPVVEHDVLVAEPVERLAQLREPVRAQHELVPRAVGRTSFTPAASERPARPRMLGTRRRR